MRIVFPGSILLLLCSLACMVGSTQGAFPALSSAGFISSVEMIGTVVWHLGSDEQTGAARLQASANGQSRVELQLARGTRIETQNAFTDEERACTWSGFDGQVHAAAWHNCWLGTVWFLPQITLQRGAGAPDGLITRAKAQDGGDLLHHERHPKGVRTRRAAELFARLSASDLHIDPETGHPQILFFNAHSDNDASTNIATEIHFSDYRNVQGVAIPFHIEKFVNHSLVLDLQIAEVKWQ